MSDRRGSFGGLGAFSVRRGVTTAMAYLCLSGLGLYSLYNLPLNRLPEVDLPVVAVVTTYTGASPGDMETLVTEPIERAVSSVENVESVRSTSRQSASIVIISFTWGTDMDAAEIEVRKNLDLFAGEFLPDEATKPLTFAFDPSLAPVMFMAVEGPLDGHRLRRVATEQVQPYLGRVEGVAAAEVIGGLEREIQVRLQPTWMEALDLSPAAVIDALRAANVIVPSGAIDDGSQALALQPTGLYRSVEEIERTVVAVRGGRPVLLSEVAEVVDTFEEETHVVTANGAPAVLMAVRKQSDANTVQVAGNVRGALPEIVDRLPAGVTIVPLFDESESILRAIRNLGSTALQAFLLTGVVLLVFLRSWRTSLIAVVAVPTSILVSFTVMQMLDVTLNLVSLAGLALAIGMLVDNGIVVLEAAFQHVEKGKSPSDAAIDGTNEMALAVTASTLTTVVVFLPILLVEGIAGELFRDLVITVTVSLMMSLLVAVTLVPVMAAKLVGRDRHSRLGDRVRRMTGFVDRIPVVYERALTWAFRHRRRVLVASFGTFFVSVALVPVLGQDFLPKADVSEIRIEATAAPGTSLDRMRELIGELEALIADTVPEARVVTADYGSAEGFSAIFGGRANEGTLRIKLPVPADRERTQQEIEQALTALFAEIAGLDVEISVFQLSGGSGDVAVELFSEDLDELRDFGETLRDELGRVEGVQETRFSMVRGSPELQLTYDRDRMRTLGLTPGEVAAVIATQYQGEAATFFRDGGDEFMVRVRAPREARSELDRLRYLPIPLRSGATVPLASIASIDDRLGPTDIDHENQRRIATVEVVAGDVDLGGLTRRIERRIEEIGPPDDLNVEIAGTAEDLRDAFFKLAIALLAAIVLVYMVMASQFESLLEPFVIMFTVPLAVIGVVAALLITGTTLQVTALVGMILLAGVVVNNAIVLIDVLKRRREEGLDLETAAREAARTRIRPILMTSLTTIFGMLPLAFGFGDGAETWAPMARAVVGGMTVATALTLFVIPLMYVSMVGWGDRRRARAGDAHQESSSDAQLPEITSPTSGDVHQEASNASPTPREAAE